jgi:predicted double-glycine peptidase
MVVFGRRRHSIVTMSNLFFLVSMMYCLSVFLVVASAAATNNNCNATNDVIAPDTAVVSLQVNTARFYPTFYQVPLYKQTTVYTCGPSSLWSALTALNIQNITEDSLAIEMHTNDTFGTLLSEMRDAAARRGLDTELFQNSTSDDIRSTIASGKLAVVLYEAWAEEYDTAGANVWDAGHFSVAFGFDTANVYLMDPWTGEYGYIPWGQFLNERWHSPDPFGEFGICQRCFLAVGPGLPRSTLIAPVPSGEVLKAVPRPDSLILIQ